MKVGKFRVNVLFGKETVRGQITVMMSLMILLLMIFAVAILESASIQTSKNIRRADIERAVESLFGEYQKELLETYDIFGLDGTYETGTYSEEKVVGRLSVFGAVGGETQIEAVRFLSDDQGQEFADQICNYIEDRYGIDAVKALYGKEEEAREQEKNAQKYKQKEEANEQKMEELLVSEKTGEESGGSSEDKAENPLEILQKMKRKVLTEIVLPGERSISQKTVEGMPGVSGRKRREGKGSVPSRQENSGQKLYLLSYIPEHFANYIDAQDDRPLEYEQEYLIGGKSDDMSNLEVVLEKIRNLRLAPNYLYLQTDETKKAEAKVLAGIISTLFGNPELTDVVSQGVLMAWAYGESVMDLRTLMAGGKIPLTKTKETWKLSLSGLLKLGTKEDSGSSESGDSGLEYEDYMKLLLVMESKEQLQMRMLDLIEWNMRIRLECPFFQADACITRIRTESICQLRRGITYRFSTYYAYQ